MSEEKLHPLRGIGATIGGALAGLGVGLMIQNPAGGLLSGIGLGLLVTAILRAKSWRRPYPATRTSTEIEP